jgi:Tfp pilus assembly protein PilZ
MDDYSNRRRHRRITATIPVRISTIEPERDPWTGRPFFRATQEHCANLSRGGAFVQTVEPIAPGRRVIVELELPSGERLEAIGRVAWAKTLMAPGQNRGEGAEGGGIGVEFLGGAANHFSQLESYITDSGESTTD